MIKYTRALLLAAALLCCTFTMAQPQAYRLFDAKGQTISYDKMLSDLKNQDVVFFGEMHNDPICHWMEVELLKSLYGNWGKETSLGMEMFEADNQLIIDEYWQGIISSKNFEDEVRLWPNYSTDYAPTVDFAYENHIPLVATNVPRRYATVVKNHGLTFLDSLSKEAKEYLPSLPIPYKENVQTDDAFQMMAAIGKDKKANAGFMGQSQGLKDATMAWFISRRKTKKMLHVNGNYHSQGNDGTVKYLKIYAPKTKIKTIYSVRQEDISKLDSTYLGLGDYYLAVPESMVTSY